MEKRIDYTQVIWEITRQLQDAESLEDALRGVDLDIRKGEFLVILGESG